MHEPDIVVFCYRRLEHNVLAVIGRQSWLSGFNPRDILGCVVAAFVLEDNTVALLNFQPDECVMDQ